MGCCYSADLPPPPPPNSATAKQTSISKSPPTTSPPAEEETVKEVLSETPPPKLQSPFIKSAPLLADFRRTAVASVKPFPADDASDASEICSSLSESVSTAAEKRPELRQRSPARVKNRSFSGEMPRKKTVGRSPGRTHDPSPNRARPGPTRRMEHGECSGRRSESPVTRAGLERTQSGRKTGKSPSRVGAGLGGKGSGDSKWLPTNSNESLENPLVSLECFIFL